MSYKRLGDMLLESGYISQDQLENALASQAGTGKRLGRMLIELGYITERDLIDVLCMQLGLDFFDFTNVVLPPELTAVIPKKLARKYNMVPVRTTPNEVYLAMSDPMDFKAQEEARTACRKRIIPVISTADAIERGIMQLYGNEGAAKAIEDMRNEIQAQVSQSGDIRFVSSTLGADEDSQNAPTIRLVNSIIERAATERASDIHLEPREKDMQVRLRVDGIMRNVLTVPRELQGSVISRLKIMSGMNIAEHRVPQDGRANVRLKQRDIDLRLSTLPTIYGESVVIRLLDKDAQLLEPESLGLVGDNLRKYQALVRASNGVVLIVGPTGSGKSSTMYTMIRQLNRESVNLVTLEDPVEYNVDGVNQVQINEKAGMTFASGLRSILRQDPDIIAVGEIRDGETAEIAMRAAITGHQVLSTIHTYDAYSTIDRLSDIGVEPYLIASGLRGIISQRLVRKVCPHCKKEHVPDAAELEALGISGLPAGMRFYKGEGCPLCFRTGYRGRVGVFEILVVNKELRHAIADRASRAEIHRIIQQSDFVSLRSDIIRLLKDGVTTVEEAARTLNSLE